MKRVAAVLLLTTACAVGSTPTTAAPIVPAAAPGTPVRVVTDWGSNNPQVRVVIVNVDGKSVTCIEAREHHSKPWGSSDGTDTAGIGISCDWSPK